MKILMVNKFLYPKGGAETYTLKLGNALKEKGNEVQYFGMEHLSRIVGNHAEAYTSHIDFHGSSMLVRSTYPFRIIYSHEARKKIRRVLEDFQPDVCHLNNFNYQLTPSIILEIRKWEKESGHSCKIVYTAHDGQLVCPNHMMKNPNTGQICEKCLGGHFWHCAKGKCIHRSFARSVIGSLEGYFWKWMGVYRQLDTIICPSHFMKTKLDSDPVLAQKTVALHNFVDPVEQKEVTKKDYVLYFGRYSQEKGIATLAQAAKELPEIPFVFAGSGPLEHLLEGIPNIQNMGFQIGEVLKKLIREARFTVCPSECYEAFGLVIAESIVLGTPVLGAKIGGIVEIIQEGVTGELFESGNVEDLKAKAIAMWRCQMNGNHYLADCNNLSLPTIQDYIERLMIYY